MIFKWNLDFIEVWLVSDSDGGGGEPDKTAPPGGEAEQPSEPLRGENLKNFFLNTR